MPKLLVFFLVWLYSFPALLLRHHSGNEEIRLEHIVKVDQRQECFKLIGDRILSVRLVNEGVCFLEQEIKSEEFDSVFFSGKTTHTISPSETILDVDRMNSKYYVLLPGALLVFDSLAKEMVRRDLSDLHGNPLFMKMYCNDGDIYLYSWFRSTFTYDDKIRIFKLDSGYRLSASYTYKGKRCDPYSFCTSCFNLISGFLAPDGRLYFALVKNENEPKVTILNNDLEEERELDFSAHIPVMSTKHDMRLCELKNKYETKPSMKLLYKLEEEADSSEYIEKILVMGRRVLVVYYNPRIGKTNYHSVLLTMDTGYQVIQKYELSGSLDRQQMEARLSIENLPYHLAGSYPISVSQDGFIVINRYFRDPRKSMNAGLLLKEFLPTREDVENGQQQTWLLFFKTS